MPSHSRPARRRTPAGRRRGRRAPAARFAAILLAAGVLVGLVATLAAAQPAGGGTVEIVEVDGIVDRTVAGHLVEVLETANAGGAEVVVVRLNSPGTLGGAAERLAAAIDASRVPVVVWVGPPGGRAVGGALLVAESAHLLAVAPGTLLGAGAPLDLAADATPDAVEAAAARLAEVAAERGRDADFAAAAARGAAVVAAPPSAGRVELPEDADLPPGVVPAAVEVLDEGRLVERGLAEFTAASLPDVLRDLDGRTVALDGAGGDPTRTLAVDTVEATVRFHNLGLLRRVLHAVADPTLAYLLVVAGGLALLFEVFQPGFGVAGVSGVGLAAAGVYGLAVLPVSWLALAVLVAGLLLLAADLALGRLGLLTAGGTVAFAAGSWLLFDGPALLRVSPWVAGLVTVFTVVFFVGVMTTVLRAQGRQALAGAEDVVGKTGVVRSVLNPEGHVFVGGALWRARAPESAGKVRSGTQVRVVGLDDGLTLEVEPAAEPAEPAKH